MASSVGAMVWRAQSIVLAFGLVLAGCLDDARDTSGDTDREATDATHGIVNNVMLQTGCQSFYSYHRVDLPYAEARLPEGLEPYPYDAGGALLTLKSWTCPESLLDNESVASGASIVYYIAVVPQGGYNAEHVGFSWYPLEIVTATEDLAAAFTAWGFTNAAAGDVSISWDAGDPWLVTVAAQGTAAVDARVTIPGFASQDGSFTVRYFAGDGEHVTSAVDIVVYGGDRGGGGPTILSLQGAHAPAPAPLPGKSSYQGWDEGQISYMWTPVSFEI